MAQLLTGDLCGWPPDRITPLVDVAAPHNLATLMVDAVRDAQDVLVVYYVGHGIRTSEGQLALAVGVSDVPDGLWERIEPLLPPVERRYRYPGRKRLDDRKVLSGILLSCTRGSRGSSCRRSWASGPGDLLAAAAGTGMRPGSGSSCMSCCWPRSSMRDRPARRNAAEDVSAGARRCSYLVSGGLYLGGYPMADINLLVVADGIFIFGPQVRTQGTPDGRDLSFTVNTFLSILEGSTSPSIAITTAHRSGDPDASITEAFNFQTTIPDLSVFDVIWLFGDEGTNHNSETDPGGTAGPLAFIGAGEIAAVAEFMNGGGGVFATGDHEGLGSLMCGLLPRVRSMRAWFSEVDTDSRIPAGAPRNWPVAGPGRADTLQVAADGTWFFDNQSDDLAQKLSFPNGTTHPVLQGANGHITHFPDHMHEGQVILPWTYSDPLIPGDSRREYPTVGGHQEKPLILATGNTVAGHPSRTQGESGSSSCEQIFFDEKKNTQSPGFALNTLGAYDGHTVGVGRVVVDSSFHHYLDLNLVGDPCAAPGVKQQGFTTAQGAPVLADLAAFYVNTVAWLARQVKTCSLLVQNSTFGKDQLTSIGLPAAFQSAFWVVMDGFLPSELSIDATGHLTDPAAAPAVSFTIEAPASSNPAIVTALTDQLIIPPFTGQVLTDSLPPAPNTPQRFLYPFQINFRGTDGFVLPNELLTLTAKITVGGTPFSAFPSAQLDLTTAANPYVTDVDAGNDYTSWLSTDLRVFKVDDDQPFFGDQVSHHYPPGQTGSLPVSAAAASAAATQYIAGVISGLKAGIGSAGGDSFEHSLSELEDASISQLEFLQVNPRTGRPAFNFAICRVRIRGTTPTGPGTTQAIACRVFFRAFQAQTTVSSFDEGTTYRATPVPPGFGRRVPLLGVEQVAGADEYVTLPFFAVDRFNLNGPADLTQQPADTPNVQTISPKTGQEVDTYFGCWLDMNQPTPLFPKNAPPGDFDNAHGSFNTPGYPVTSINAAFTRAPHQCLIAEVAFDSVPIPAGATTSTSDKLAQRNLAYIDGPNPGLFSSRRMPHPFQVRATAPAATHVDELMIAWGNTPAGSTASIYLPGVPADAIIALADSLYGNHDLTRQDAHTIEAPSGPITFVPIPEGTGLLAGLLTVDLPLGITRGDRYTLVMRQVTDASARTVTGRGQDATDVAAAAATDLAVNAHGLSWRQVLGAFQVNLDIATKQQLLPPEEHRLALFRWIAEEVPVTSRWYPVLQRYVDQLAGRVDGFGGDPGAIGPSPIGYVPGLPEPHPGHGGDVPATEVTGKVDGIVYDHFGDFEGFIVETPHHERHRFSSRERRVLDLVRRAERERLLVTVTHLPGQVDVPLLIVVHAPTP